MTLEDMKKRKQELGYSIETLAKLAGVPVSTLRKIFSGQTKSPRRDTIEKLSAILDSSERHAADRGGTDVPGMETYPYDLTGRSGKSGVKEGSAVYDTSALQPDNPYGSKKQGEYTIEDYFALPDDQRYELIDGVIYDMASPTRDHQVIAGYLYYRLMTCAEEHPSECRPYMSPLDVQLDKDNKTMVQPDVIVCCSPEQDSGQRIFGAPDFLAEVVSPSSKKRDRFIKLQKYENAGVREYWLIEPKRLQVIVFLFEKDCETHIYSFDDEIPVYISGGSCKVCFAPVKDRMTKGQPEE